MSEQKCRICDCTNERACTGDDGQACYWVGSDLCSACFLGLCSEQVIDDIARARLDMRRHGGGPDDDANVSDMALIGCYHLSAIVEVHTDFAAARSRFVRAAAVAMEAIDRIDALRADGSGS